MLSLPKKRFWTKAGVIRRLQDVELPKLQSQLAETEGLFKSKERKALEQKIQQTEFKNECFVC